jgi:Domain of unknown function (DUF4872)/Butirosin biosynthesis protein H, N-terminal
MTEQKKLKNMVRARAARTGESYTTARRQVRAKRGEPGAQLDGVVAGYPGFGAGEHHDSTLLARLLEQAGVRAPHTDEPYSEAMLTGLAGGIGFMYAVFEYKGWAPALTIVAQHHPQPWLPAALDNLGLPYTEQRTGKASTALERLSSTLAAGRAAYCTVDRTRLPWHAARTGMSTDPYGVVVAGIDDGMVRLDDGKLREMSEEDFGASWSGYTKGRHHMLTIGESAADVSVDLQTGVRSAVRTTVDHLTGPVLGNSFDVNFGFSGMAKLAEHLRDGRGKSGWARRFGGDHFALAMRRLHECLEVEYTASGATRPIYAEFLEQAAPLFDRTGTAAVRDAAGSVRESGRRWSTIAGIAAEAGESPLPTDERPPLFERVADLVDAARTLEAEAVAALVRAI